MPNQPTASIRESVAFRRDDAAFGGLILGLDVLAQTARALGHCPPSTAPLMTVAWWTIEAEEVVRAWRRPPGTLSATLAKVSERHPWRSLADVPAAVAGIEERTATASALLAGRGDGRPCPR